MQRKSFVLLVMGTVVFFLCSISSADVPDSINYQGKLTTAQGGCLNDTVSMTFTIYSDDQGTVVDWTEIQNSVIVKEGIFNVLLGSVNPLPASLFDGSVKYLGVKVESDDEMRPLKPMVSVAYAYRAGTADGGGGGWVDDGTVVRLADSTDQVGIGTSNPRPGYKLHLKDAPGVYLLFDHGRDTTWILGSSVPGNQSFYIGQQNPYGGISRLRIMTNGDTQLCPATGNVGIGMTSPTEKLDVAGNIHTSGTITSGSSITIDGANDRITATSGTIDFDDENLVTTGKATIGPGHNNAGIYAFVAGQNNTTTGWNSTVGGGRDNMAGNDGSTVGGGAYDTASGIYSTVSGGAINVASGQNSTVAGGNVNLASGDYSTVSGGAYDTASGWVSSIGGGTYNVASGDYATVGGGFHNRARGQWSVVSGGGGPTPPDSNSAIGDYSAIGGGQRNITSGLYASIPGGLSNTAAGSYSFAAGRRAKANHAGTFVWADQTDADFASGGNDQFLIRASGGVGIGTTSPEGALDVSSTTGAFIVPRMTTAQRDALTPVNGMIIYNTTANQFNFYENGAWVTK